MKSKISMQRNARFCMGWGWNPNRSIDYNTHKLQWLAAVMYLRGGKGGNSPGAGPVEGEWQCHPLAPALLWKSGSCLPWKSLLRAIKRGPKGQSATWHGRCEGRLAPSRRDKPALHIYVWSLWEVSQRSHEVWSHWSGSSNTFWALAPIPPPTPQDCPWLAGSLFGFRLKD